MFRQLVIAGITALFFSSTSVVMAEDSKNPSAAANWDPYLSLGGYYGSDNTSYGEVGIFAPLAQDGSSLWFTEFQGKFFENDVSEGNAAIGYRQMMGDGYNLGAWVGLDLRNTFSDNMFTQVSGGVEALSERFDFRANAYLPITDKQTAAPGVETVFLSGSSIAMRGVHEVALHGVDAEFGTRLPLGENNKGHLGVYGGGFWFDSDDAFEEIAGFKGRVELAVNDVFGAGSSLTGGYEYTNDDVRGDRHKVGIRLRFALGDNKSAASDMSAQEWRMVDHIVRDTDIVIGESDAEQVADAYTNVRFDRVESATDSGTLTAAIGEGANTLIILDGAGNPIDGGHTLSPDQTLLGGGGMLRVVGLETGAVSYFNAAGTQPMLTSDGDVLTMASNTHATGLHIEKTNAGTIGRGIVATGGLDNVAVTYNTIETHGRIEGNSSYGIQLEGSHLHIVDNNITTNGVDALGVFANNSQDVWIKDNNITTRGSLAEAVAIWENNQDIDVRNNVLRTTSLDLQAHGIIVGSGNNAIDLAENDIETASTNGAGIVLLSGVTDTTITGNMVKTTGNAAQGFYSQGSNTFITVSDNSFTTTALDAAEAIWFGNHHRDITVSDNTVSTMGVQAQGIRFGNFNRRVGIRGNSVETAGTNAAGVVMLSNNRDFTIADNIFNTEGEGVFTFDHNAEIVIIGNTITSGKIGMSFGRQNTLQITGNSFVDMAGFTAIEFRSPGNTVLINSTGNTTDGSTSKRVCGAGNYIGADIAAFQVDGFFWDGGQSLACP